MKEFIKRLLVVLSFPLWIVIHLIYLVFYIYILGTVGLVVVPLTYLIIGQDLYLDWWVDKFDYSIEAHKNFVAKIVKL